MPQNLRVGFKGASFRCFKPAGGGQERKKKRGEEKTHLQRCGVCQF